MKDVTGAFHELSFEFPIRHTIVPEMMTGIPHNEHPFFSNILLLVTSVDLNIVLKEKKYRDDPEWAHKDLWIAVSRGLHETVMEIFIFYFNQSCFLLCCRLWTGSRGVAVELTDRQSRPLTNKTPTSRAQAAQPLLEQRLRLVKLVRLQLKERKDEYACRSVQRLHLKQR